MHCKTVTTMALCALLAGAGSTAMAQKIYRIVGPDGRITFSDQAPLVDTPAASASAATASAPSPGHALNSLPLGVKQAASQYPFTLYTASDCGACDSARSYLQRRGVPYAEKTITSNEEIQALQQLSGNTILPFATLGGQHLSGFSTNDWSSYLDAAGYPAQSQLPASYHQAAAVPLIGKTLASPASTAEPVATTAPASDHDTGVQPQRVTPQNPNGIVF